MNENIQVFDIANELIIIPKAVIDTFLKYKNPSELIALYSFYYYTAKWQKTNQPKCSTVYTAKGLHWNKDKVIRIKKQLIEIGLVQDIKNIDPTTKKIKGWYVKINYIFKRETVNDVVENHPPSFPEGGNSQRVETEETNALSTNNLNALSTNNKTIANKCSKEHLRLSGMLADYINSDDPNYRELLPDKKERTINNWANSIRLLEERDHRTIREIEHIIKWSKNHDFWNANIMSGSKLRKQFSKLYAQAKTEHKKKNNSHMDNMLKELKEEGVL